MFRRIAAVAALWLFAVAPALAADVRPMDGFYAGGWGTPGLYMYTQLDLSPAQGGGLKGTLATPYNSPGKTPLEKVTVDGARLQFDANEQHWDLTRTETGYAGVMTGHHDARFPARFVLRPGGPKPEVLAGYEGTYDMGAAGRISLSRNNASSGFWWLQWPTGRSGYLFNLADDRFIAGQCFYCVDAAPLRIDMVRDKAGRATAIKVALGGKSVRAPRMTDVREETVAFTGAGGVKLEGTVFLPAGAGPHPGLVLVHGSGAQSRNGFYGQMRFMAEAYARAGIAVLAYDKRGVGGSQGDWEVAGLDLLARDAAAAVKALRARPDVDPKRVGLSGSSQAGWIIPMATRYAPGVALIQIRSGSSPMGVEESEWRRLVLQMKGELLAPSPAEIDRALKIRHMMDAYAKTGQGWAELEAAFKPVEKTVWAQNYLGGLPPKDAPDWPWLKEAFSYDTTADFARWKGPLQVLYGEVDFVPTAQARPMLEAALGAHAKDPDVSIAVWPGANHNYYAARSAADSEFPGLRGHVPGFYDCVTGWAAEQFGLKPKGSATKTCPA